MKTIKEIWLIIEAGGEVEGIKFIKQTVGLRGRKNYYSLNGKIFSSYTQLRKLL